VRKKSPPMHRGELHIGGLVVFTTILRVVTTPNTHGSRKFRGTAEINPRTKAATVQ